MRLELENVGKINSADIELNGITVIAGENNVGKSTIGKMLFCILHAFYRIEAQIREERVKSVSRVINSYYHETTNRFTENFDCSILADRIVDRRESFLGDTRHLVKEIEKLILSKDNYFESYMEQEALEKTAKKVYGFLNLEDTELRKVILRKRLEAEFGMKVGHLNNINNKAVVKLNIKNSSVKFEVIGNKDIEIEEYANLNQEIVYIDDPFVLDNLMKPHVLSHTIAFEHRQDLLKKLTAEKRGDFSVADEIIIEERLKKIWNLLSDVCDGSIIIDEGGEFVYRTEKLNGHLDMVNLSTGMKSFAILRRLLQNGNIDENGVIILDEPEIHLHPEWQLKFAESIILIQKEFGAKILLNTHSPYFLNAIEVYSGKYQINQQCRFYLVEEDEGNATVIDITDDTESIYAKLARPLQELENLEYRDGITL